MNELQHHIEAKREFGRMVCNRIAENIAELGFSLHENSVLPQFDSAEFNLVTDPYSQSQDLVGFWYNVGKQRIGQIKFHGDGSFYAEYDVVQPHPNQSGYFVEAINAWGRQDSIKTEAKLLDLPRE